MERETTQPDSGDKEPSNSRRALRIAFQIIGFLAGIAALIWCLNKALTPENRRQLATLPDKPTHLILALVGLSLLSMSLNGMAFWIALWPVRRLRIPDVLATNALCTFLGYMPFKMGAILRVVIHNRRDKVPVVTIGAWFTALAAVMAVTFTVMCTTIVGHGKVDAVWFALTLGGLAIAGAIIVGAARRFRGEIGIQRLERLVGFTHIPLLKRPLRSRLWMQLHTGFDMLASPGATAAAMINRLADSGVQSMRFMVAAQILDKPLTLQQALLVSMLYFIVGIASPAGLAGLRDGAVAGFTAKLLAMAGMNTSEGESTFALLAVVVTATEFIAFLIAGGVGIAWLRPDRLIKLRGAPESNDPGTQDPGPAT